VTDAHLALYRGISDAELLRAHQLFVAEGRLVVRRVLEDLRYQVHSVLVNDAARVQLADVLDAAPDVPVIVAPTEAFGDVTGFNIHRGCLALVHRPPEIPVDALMERSGTLLVLDGVANADNVGGIFRNVAAFGAAGVILDPTSCDPLYRKAIRTSMGAVLRVPFARAGAWPAVLATARRRGFLVAALTPREPADCIEAFASSARGRRVALVVGAEGAGVSAAVEAIADARVKIPMVDGVDSLNAAVAAGIALYELYRVR